MKTFTIFSLLLIALLFMQGFFLATFIGDHNWVISGCLVFSGIIYILGFVEGIGRS